jgi:hypothetical protein
MSAEMLKARLYWSSWMIFARESSTTRLQASAAQ